MEGPKLKGVFCLKTQAFMPAMLEIDTSTFVTIGKFAAFLKEKAPCAMIDVDLVIWENSRPDSIWYPDSDRLPRRRNHFSDR